MTITEAMEDVAGKLRPHVSRQVTTDPTRTANTPCVLVEVPTVEASGTLCGEYLFTHTLIVIGMQGARAELGPLSALLDEVLIAIDEIGWGWTRAEPVTYVPLQDGSNADPCQAYRLTIERFQ